MPTQEILRRAITKARAGHRVEARDLLLEVVQDDPQCEIAWIWLSGLVDLLEDKIIACENVLVINPSNDKVRAYLLELKRQQVLLMEKGNAEEALRLLNQANSCLDQNDKGSALYFATQAVEKDRNLEGAWL